MTGEDILDSEARVPSNSKWFREVLGQYPTGVCVVTAMTADRLPVGMAVGSFTSVSLNPPLVAFFPDRASTSWPRVKQTERFCVNILSAEQESVCRRFASKAENKFQGLAYRTSMAGSPVLEGVVAWIDCAIDSVAEAGDHFIVKGRVEELHIESSSLPLLFFQGGYGRFLPLSLAAPDLFGTLTEQLRNVDAARPEMEELASVLAARCIATARVDTELVIAASSGSVHRGAVATLVGQRLPFMPPTGSVFAAWNGQEEVESWLSTSLSLDARDSYRATLNTVRERGYSVGLRSDAQRSFASALGKLAAGATSDHDVDLRQLIESLIYDPAELTASIEKDIRLISAPVFGPHSQVALALTVYEYPKPTQISGIRPYVYRLLEAAARVTTLIGGIPPRL